MAKYQAVFRRVEKKYVLTEERYDQLLEHLIPHMEFDEYGLHTICNIYYDTRQYELIRHSIEKPIYKEKLRLRSYGIPTKESDVFLEIKKKWKGVVYKRRSAMSLKSAVSFLEQKEIPSVNSQILREIAYFLSMYPVEPKQFIAYDRIAMYGKEDSELRITFDANIRSRDEELSLAAGDYGSLLLPPGERIMEIKMTGAMPLWLAHTLSELSIFPTSFSKYGNLYKKQGGY